MVDKQDFLSALRVRNSDEDYKRVLKSPAELRVQFSLSNAGDILIGIVDKEGHTQAVSEYYASGSMAGLLRTLMALDQDKGLTFSWPHVSYKNRWSMRDFPFLTAYLPACRDVLVDTTMKPLELVEEPQPVTFRLSHVSDEMMQGSFEVSGMPVMAFVNDRYALTPKKIVAVRNVGPQFADAMAFAEPFAAHMAENFLSILYSDMKNVDVDFEGRIVQREEEPAEMTPVLLFEKVDSDNALQLRVTETVGNIPMDICENFRLTSFVSLTEEKIYVRRLGPGTIEEKIRRLQEQKSALVDAVISSDTGGKSLSAEDITFLLS